MEVNFSGAEAANIGTGELRAFARGESAMYGVEMVRWPTKGNENKSGNGYLW